MEHAQYILLVQMPDAKRILRANSICARTDAQRAFVFDECRRAVCSQNPDIKYDPTTFLNGPFNHDQANQFSLELEAKLNAEDPDRKSITDLRRAGAIDEPARLLHDPEIARMLAAQKEAAKASA